MPNRKHAFWSCTAALLCAVGATNCDEPAGSSGAGSAATTGSAASSAGSPAASAAHAAAESPFHRYAQGAKMSLGGTFGTTAALFVGGALFPVDIDGAQQIEGVHRFTGPGNSTWGAPIHTVLGVWPDRAFHVGTSSDSDVISLWRPNDKRNSWFSDPHGGSDRDPFIDASLYLDGSVLAMQMLNYDWKFWLSNKQSSKVLTLPSPGSAPAGAKECKVPLIPHRIQSFASGEVFVLGVDCKSMEDKAPKLAVQRWDTSSRKGTVDVLPDALHAIAGDNGALGKVAFEAFAPNDIYVATPTAGAHFDGSSWSVVDGLKADGRRGLALAQDKSLWAVSGGKLSKRAADGKSWQEVALPPEVSAIAIGNAPGNVPWVLAQEGNHNVLLGPASKAAPTTMPSPEEANAAMRGELPGASSACKTLFVPLRMNVSKGQGFDDVKQPIDASVKSVSYGIASFGQADIFGAIPASYLDGVAIVGASKKADPKSIARLTCQPAAAQ